MGYDDSGMISAGVSALVSLIYLVMAFGGYILYSWFYMKLFEKAGVQGKWRAWVPVYNYMIFLKLGDLSPWLVLYLVGAGIVGAIIPVLGWFLILPLAGLAARVLGLIAAWRVGLKLQKEAVWVILYFFLDLVWLGIMAFDKSRWNPMIAAAPWAGNALLSDRTTWEGIPAQPSMPQAAPGYGAAPQGYAPPSPQGYPQGYPQQGYGAPAQPGYGAPAQPGYGAPVPPTAGAPVPPVPGAPVPPAPGAPVPPPATPPAPPTAPPTAPPAPPAAPPVPPVAPPAADPAPPAADPTDPADPNQPPA